MVNELDAIFGALADPTRRAILADLAANGTRTAGELAGPHQMSLPAFSKHLAALERAGLMSRTRRGRNHLCTLAPRPLREADTWLARYREFWSDRLDSLAAYVEAAGDESAAS